jgi:hypothetical protein
LALGPAGQAAQEAPAGAAGLLTKTLEQTASPELVGQLVKDLAVTPGQAEGAAGAMFGLAKSRLPAADFAKVAGAVPNIEGLIKAAPALGDKAPAALAIASAAGVGGMTSLAGSFAKLALKPETIAKLAPTLIKAVEGKGGADVGKLLASVLK